MIPALMLADLIANEGAGQCAGASANKRAFAASTALMTNDSAATRAQCAANECAVLDGRGLTAGQQS